MTDNIIEGNKAIAIFDGWKYIEDGDSFYKAPNILFPQELKYHTSWDWLMPVVQKIADIDSSFHMLMGNVATTCHFESQYEAKKIGEGWKSTDENTIKAVYSAVIEFITYYNSNHLKQTV